MADERFESDLRDFLDVREPTANYEEHRHDQPLLGLTIDPDYRRFPRLDDTVTYKKEGTDHRGEIRVDQSAELPDYSGPFRADLRFSDFTQEALIKVLSMADEYYALIVNGWAAELAERRGRETMFEIQEAGWSGQVLPQIRRIVGEFMELTGVDADAIAVDLERAVAAARASESGVVLFNPFRPDPSWVALPKERLVRLALGSHEFFLLVIEAWAAQVVVRYGLDDMFAVQWALWSEKVLPETRDIKIRWMNITGHNVEAFMKDIQMDATSFPGKAFEMTFDMPEKDVGIMTFNRCCAPAQWEALGRPDILEKGCHSTCPASLIETAKMYHPNMKIDILAIPPRVSTENVCCKWKLSMRDADDPEYVSVDALAQTLPGRPAD